MSHSDQMRRWMRLMEDAGVAPGAPNSVEQYISRYPQAVSGDMQTLLDDLRDHARETASAFLWAIGRLPDGRFVSGSKSAMKRWGLPVVKQGSDEDL